MRDMERFGGPGVGKSSLNKDALEGDEVHQESILTIEDAEVTQRALELMTKTAIQRLNTDIFCGSSWASRVTKYGSSASDCLISSTGNDSAEIVDVLADIIADKTRSVYGEWADNDCHPWLGGSSQELPRWH